MLRYAYEYAQRYSGDTKTQVGAILIGDFGSIQGTNRFPNKIVASPDRLASPLKYDYMIHAEQDVIMRALIETRKSLANTTLYCPWACCTKCAQLIIQSGITRVVVHKECMDRTPERWLASISTAKSMLTEAGIEYTEHSCKVGTSNIFNGEVWFP